MYDARNCMRMQGVSYLRCSENLSDSFCSACSRGGGLAVVVRQLVKQLHLHLFRFCSVRQRVRQLITQLSFRLSTDVQSCTLSKCLVELVSALFRKLLFVVVSGMLKCCP